MLKELIGLLWMELMLLKYWKLKTKVIDHVNKMADYMAEHKFQTVEAKGKLREIYKICDKETGSDADGHNKGTASGIPE